MDGQLGVGSVFGSSVPVEVDRSGVLAGRTVTREGAQVELTAKEYDLLVLLDTWGPCPGA